MTKITKLIEEVQIESRRYKLKSTRFKKLWMCYNLILIIVLCGFWGNALAADVHLEWDTSANATGYKIYKSEDLMISWDSGIDVGNVTNFTYPGVVENIWICFKIGAYNGVAETITEWATICYNHSLRPVEAAKGLNQPE
jgi:hypothetical protein